jgi:hypothetical protein
MGIIRGVMTVRPFLVPDLKHCPGSFGPIFGLGAIIRYLRSHWDAENEDIYVVMLRAFHEEWPCR